MSAPESAAAPAPRTGTPTNFPGMLGVYLAVNAVPDLFALVDGPDCALYKAHFIHGRHDWESTLLRADGRHRIAFTNVCARGVVREHDEIVAAAVRRLDALPDCAAILVTALPMCSITGVDYGRITRALAPELRGTAFDAAPGSLVGDWLDGYASALTALAKAVAPGPGRTRPGTVAFVGHMMDRNEADRRADARELERLAAGLGLECVSIWLSGRPFSELKRVEEAAIVVSLPYGRAAARLIAERTGAALVEAPLPFGLPKTAELVRLLGAAAGAADRAESFVAAELARVVPRFRWVLPHAFVGRRVAFVGDPHLFAGFVDIAADCGLELKRAALTARRAHGGEAPGVLVEHEPPEESPETFRGLTEGVDLLVCCHLRSFARLRGRLATLELGFPSWRHHAFYERPALGFDGFAGFLDRMAEALGRRP